MSPPYNLFHSNDVNAAESLAEIREAFAPDRRKVFIVGAGASKSAGIPTFDDRTSVLHQYGGRSILSENVFRTAHETAKYLKVIESMLEDIARAVPTPFHWMLDSLARRGDEIRIYTQNIDGLEFRCPRLSRKNVVPIHGQIGKMACYRCHEVYEMDITAFSDGCLPLCPVCPNKKGSTHPDRTRLSLPREANRRDGLLKPYVRLYDGSPEDWPGLEFDQKVQEDLCEQPPHTVIVAGTNLAVSGAERLVLDMCKSSHDSHYNGIALWLNPRDIPKKLLEAGIFDYAVKATCDEFAAFVGI